jgi:hypothetical protein
MLLTADFFPNKAFNDLIWGLASKNVFFGTFRPGVLIKKSRNLLAKMCLVAFAGDRRTFVRNSKRWWMNMIRKSCLKVASSFGHRRQETGDIRFPKHKTFRAFNNVERLVGALAVSKVRMKPKPRRHFSACGTYMTSYSDVPIRNLKSLP